MDSVKKLNMVKTVLPCKSLECVLTDQRDTKVQEVIRKATEEYVEEYGKELFNMTSFMRIDSRVIMSMYQMPGATIQKVRDFGAFAIERKPK